MADPVCGFDFDGVRCRKRGPHRCKGRVGHVLAFFSEALVHTKGDFAGHPFVPAPWQRDRILSPLFGDVVYEPVRGRYVRRYRLLYLCVARKNGKTELLAGMVLYMLCADGEVGAEVYGLALDVAQAGLVFNVARQMVRLKPALAARLQVLPSAMKIVDEMSGSAYSVVASDALGNLGTNPSAGYIDELLSQPNRDLYDALRTGLGTRSQPLLMLATTAESDSGGFAATERRWSERVAEDPALEPERLPVIYRAPDDADWREPATWKMANPALGDFLELRTIAQECHAAQGNPVAERAFRQYRLNQPIESVGRAIAMPVWDSSAGPLSVDELEAALVGRQCYAGLDLAATSDLAAYALVFPDGDGGYDVLFRHFVPAAALVELARRTGGQAGVWVSQGRLIVTEGNVLDYSAVKLALEADRDRGFDVQEVAFDRWGAMQLSQQLMDDGWSMIGFGQGFGSMAAPTSELLRLVGLGRFRHGGDPVARWEAGNAVTRQDPAGNIKFDKGRSSEKIDGVVAAVMGLDRAIRRTSEPPAREFAAAGFH